MYLLNTIFVFTCWQKFSQMFYSALQQLQRWEMHNWNSLKNLLIVKLPGLSYDKPWGLVRGITLIHNMKQVRSLPTVTSFNKALWYLNSGIFSLNSEALHARPVRCGVSPAPPFCISVLVLSEKYAARLDLCWCSWKLQVPHYWKSNPDAFSALGNCISLP